MFTTYSYLGLQLRGSSSRRQGWSLIVSCFLSMGHLLGSKIPLHKCNKRNPTSQSLTSVIQIDVKAARRLRPHHSQRLNLRLAHQPTSPSLQTAPRSLSILTPPNSIPNPQRAQAPPGTNPPTRPSNTTLVPTASTHYNPSPPSSQRQHTSPVITVQLHCVALPV
jgi:hypothetical protein